MTKVDFCFIVHNGMPWIKLNLENVYPFANRIIIVEGPVAFYQKLGYGASNDKTLETIHNFPDPDNKIVLESGLWNEKDDMVRAQEKHFAGDYVWVPDADEFWKPEDIQKVFDYLNTHPECHSMSFRLLSFFCGFSRFIGGFEAQFETHRIQKLSPGAHWLTHRPPTLLWTPSGKPCREMGHVDGTAELGIRIFHYSHIPPRRMREKSGYYQQLSSSILPKYFENVIVPWMRAQTDEERMVVERRYNGVQEFKPTCRGPAFTEAFVGEHPHVIQQAIPNIEKQIKTEARELGI